MQPSYRCESHKETRRNMLSDVQRGNRLTGGHKQRPCLPGLGLEVRLTTFLRKNKILLGNSKK
jgi:hypothetical protein